MKQFSKSVVSFFLIIIGLLTALIIFFKKEENHMVEVYITLIIAGRRTIGQVPATIREKVRELLVAMGLYELAEVPLVPYT